MAGELKSVYECPVCKSPVQFAHPELNITICPVCKTVLNRTDNDNVTIRQYKLIENRNDFIQPGTTGIYSGKTFTVKGRIRVWFAGSVYNYWSIILDDNTAACLAEGYGLYDIYFEKPAAELLPAGIINSLEFGSIRQPADDSLLLLDKGKCSSWDMEGDVKLPYIDEHFQVVEYGTAQDNRIVAIEFRKRQWTVFETHPVSFSELQLSNLAVDVNREKTFSCKVCATVVAVKSYPYSQSCSCPQCGAQYAIDNNREFVRRDNDRQNKNHPDIAIGAKGEIKGISYEVIGYALKQEMNSYAARWSEYVLYNDMEGYAFLSEYQGHWIYGREKNHFPVFPDKNVGTFSFEGEDFLLYNNYGYNVIDTLGEFPYDISDTKDTVVKEYISPPEMWSYEKTGGSIAWFFAEHISSKTVQKEFNARTIYKQGVGAIQPGGYVNPFMLFKVSVVCVLLFIVAHLIISETKENRVVLERYYQFADSTTSISIVSEPVRLDKWKSDIEFFIAAPIDNSWLSFDATLVNTKDGTEHSIEQPVEYYHGYEDGENWSEGSTSHTASVSSVPGGEYIIQMHGERENTNAAKGFSVTVTYDTSIAGNLWIVLGLFICIPLTWYVVIHYFEVRRWQNSDYSPYMQS